MNNFSNDLLELQKDLFGFALNFTKNFHDAEDLTQTVLLKCLKNEEKFEKGTSLKNWSFAVLRNEFINNFRLNKRKLLCKAYFKYIAENKSNPCDEFLKTKDVLKLIDAVPNKFKETIKLRIDGYKYEEIAKILNLHLGTVKSRIFFARKLLQSNL